MNVVKEDLTGLVSRINSAKELCKKDQRRLEEIVTSKQTDMVKKLGTFVEHLLEDVKHKGHSTLKVIQQLDSKRAKLIENIENTQTLCNILLNPSTSKDSKVQIIQVEKIIDKIHQIQVECDTLKKVELPRDLNMKFEDIHADITLGKLTSACSSEEVVDYYENPQVTVSQGWYLKEEKDVSNDGVDFVNIVCIDDDWIAHVSNHYGSQSITIKHYSLSSTRECREQLLLDIGTHSWTLAKTAGHDRSILLAFGKTVQRISFRRRNTEYIQKIAASTRIEAITWDEYGVDCYVLATNLCDVYWLSMNGEVTYLCAFQTKVQSVASIGVNDDFIITLLDRTAKTFHRRNCNLKADTSHKLKLSPPLPEKFQFEESQLTPYIMASRKHPENNFVLFIQGTILAIGQYDEEFRFIDWVMSTEVASDQKIIDMSVKGDKVYLLFGEKISVYTIRMDKSL